MPETVILEHILPDGSRHFDWMIEDPNLGEGRTLRTWRTEVRPDLEAVFDAEQIDHHRDHYLRHEGPVSDGRGVVHRIRRGELQGLRASETEVSVTVAWSEGPNIRYEGRFGGLGLWRFHGVPT